MYSRVKINVLSLDFRTCDSQKLYFTNYNRTKYICIYFCIIRCWMQYVCIYCIYISVYLYVTNTRCEIISIAGFPSLLNELRTHPKTTMPNQWSFCINVKSRTLSQPPGTHLILFRVKRIFHLKFYT